MLKYQHGIVGYGTTRYSLRYDSNNEVPLQRYTNSNWAEVKKSSLGYHFNLCSVMISWMSRKQIFDARSFAKAKYIVAWLAIRVVVWLQKLLIGLFDQV